jgi:hypothetical protein
MGGGEMENKNLTQRGAETLRTQRREEREQRGWYSDRGRGRGVKLDGGSRKIERPNEEF